MIKNKLKERLLLLFYAFISVFLLGYAMYLAFTAPVQKNPHRYKNTLQYDINR